MYMLCICSVFALYALYIWAVGSASVRYPCAMHVIRTLQTVLILLIAHQVVCFPLIIALFPLTHLSLISFSLLLSFPICFTSLFVPFSVWCFPN